MPQGFVDAHVHLVWGGLTLHQLDLSAMRSRSQFTAAVEAACGARSCILSLHIRDLHLLSGMPASSITPTAALLPLLQVAAYPPDSASAKAGGRVLLLGRWTDLARRAGLAPEGSWLQGWGWDESRWGGEVPNSHWIGTDCTKVCSCLHSDPASLIVPAFTCQCAAAAMPGAMQGIPSFCLHCQAQVPHSSAP